MGTVTKKAKATSNTALGTTKAIYRPMVRSRHPSHNPFRTQLRRLGFRSVIRFGSTTTIEDSIKGRIELNSPNAIKNSSSKLLMKECFTKANVKTADWWKFIDNKLVYQSKTGDEITYPLVAKSHFGSKGKGNTLLKSKTEFEEWKKGKKLSNYILEKYSNFNKEYRLHVTKDGCFYTCRKMLRQEFKDHPNSWQRHDDNCVWILEENPNFDKPINWNEIVEHCVKALVSCGLDFGACDLRVQNNTDADGNKRKSCDFIVVEINSAPSMGTVTLEKYMEKLPELLIEKYNKK